MNNYHQPLIPSQSYHLFSRAVGNEKLFLSHENYLFFLQKLKQHTTGVCKLYCYSLLPNHFHLFVKINNEEEIIKHFEEVKKIKYQLLQHNLSDFIMERFSNFLNSYTKAFNKVNNRKGALFMDYLKRSMVNDASDFTAYIWYIHKNAVHHQITKNIGDWQYDSYQSILSNAPTSLLRNKVIEWFGNKEELIKFHQQQVIPKQIKL
jgi:putative transposase